MNKYDVEADIERLEAEGYRINKKDIHIEEPIKALGVYNVKAHVHGDLTADVKVWVVKEGKVGEEAPAPAESVLKSGELSP